MANLRLIGVAAGALLTTLLGPSIARGDLAACGEIWMFGRVDCRFVPGEACNTACEPSAMEVACAAELYGECDEACTATAEAECIASCRPSCGEVCHLGLVHEDPPDSLRLCVSSCDEDCVAACDGAEDGECRSTCAHNCGEKCEAAECKGDDVEASCAPKCVTACAGSCWGRASGECQRSCQSERYPACKAELVEACHGSCEQDGGAIFCGGQFMNAADLQACADEIAAEFSLHLEVEVEADDPRASSCSVDREDTGPGLLALGLLGVIARRRRRG